MKTYGSLCSAICAGIFLFSLPAKADDGKPVSKADLDRLVTALWAEPPPTAKPPCALEMKLLRESRKEAPPRAQVEKSLRSHYEQLPQGHPAKNVTEQEIRAETDRVIQDQSKPRYFREHLLTRESDLRIEQTKLKDISDTKQETDDTFVNIGIEKNGNFRSYHVFDAGAGGQYDIAGGREARWGGLPDYARLGAIPSPLGVQMLLGKPTMTEGGVPTLSPDTAKISACASQQPGAARIYWRSGEPVAGRQTVIVTFGWPSGPAVPPANPHAKVDP